MTLEELYWKTRFEENDIHEHLPTLKKLAEGKFCVVELGLRGGNSTVGLLMGKPELLISIDLKVSPDVVNKIEEVCPETCLFRTLQEDSLLIKPIPCNVLFIDTYHTMSQLFYELERHESVVRETIAIHDTETFAECGEDPGSQGRGLRHAIELFLQRNPQWYQFSHNPRCHGLTILKRVDIL